MSYARKVFNRVIFGEVVRIRTPSPEALASLRATLRTMRRRYNESVGAGITGMELKGEFVIAADPDDPTVTTIKFGARSTKLVLELL